MLEFLITVAITGSSLLLFVYWFRYTCVLILNTKTARDFAADIVSAKGLEFQKVQAQLTSSVDVAGLCAALDRDYALLSGSLGNSADSWQVERQMLALHYQVSRVCFRATQKLSSGTSKGALQQMSMVVAHFANAMGEQMAGASA